MSTELTPAQIEQYYNVRLGNYKLRHSKGLEYRSICPLHGGSNASQLLVDFSDGHFHCFSCGKGGKKSKPYFFEMEMLARELNRSPMHDEVQASIEKILGEPIVKRVYQQALGKVAKGGWDRSQARARYMYQDEQGEETISVWRFVDRFGNKMTPPDQPCPSCRTNLNPDAECPYKCVNGRIWGITAREDGLPAARRLPYRLPDLMQSMLCFIVEGERNADDLSRALALHIKERSGLEFGSLVLDRVGVTTNSGGAGSWRKDYLYGRYFFGKTVIVLHDNDTAGKKHEKDVCEDVARYARELYTLDLPEMGASEDISDYLEKHTIREFLELLPNRKAYQLPAPKQPKHEKEDEQRVVLIKPSRLLRPEAAEERDWLVPDLISRGKRGLVVAAPKVGKSLLFCDLALCLGANQGFLGGRPYGRPVKTAIISREDGPDELYFRLKALGAARGLSWEDIDRNISVNTPEQTSRFNIDSRPDLVEMAEWLKADGAEFAVFDVLNKIHHAESNSSTDMSRIMRNFDELALLSGAQVAVIHHSNKNGGTMGSTAIEGWADYIIRLEQSPDDDALKTLFLRTKSSSSVAPRSLRYWQSEDKKQSPIQLVEMRPMAVSQQARPKIISGQSRASGGY